jgi:serine/threonine-protein kinase
MIGLGLPEEERGTGASRGPRASAEWFVETFDWAVGLGAPVVREFTREALGVARLRHPHVVQVVDAGLAPDGRPFVVMERLSGATLEERAGGTLIPLAELLPILRGVAAGLAAAQALGVAHRELRADNVFLADAAGYAYGFPKLLGFGVVHLTAGACALGHEPAALTSDAVPPEQRLDLTRGDAQSDQFAMAALAYRFLAVAEVTTPVEKVLSRAMSWHPARRFDSIAEFLEALDVATRTQALDGASAGARPDVPPAAEIAVEPPAPPPAVEASSLTQQFFAEGERLERATEEAANGSRAAAPAAADADAGEDTLSLPDRLPRSRAPMIAALSLALVSSVIVAWTALSLSDVPRWADRPAAEAVSPVAGAAPVRAAPTATQGRTASAALRAMHAPKAATRSGRPPTEPPPVVAPALPLPSASTPVAAAPVPPPPAPAVPTPQATPPATVPAPPPNYAATVEAAPPPSAPPAPTDEPAAPSSVPPAPEADPGVAEAPPPAIDPGQGITHPWELIHGTPVEDAPPAEAPAP